VCARLLTNDAHGRNAVYDVGHPFSAIGRRRVHIKVSGGEANLVRFATLDQICAWEYSFRVGCI